MKLQGHNNKLETNVESETQDFGIGDPSVVIEILRNRLYSHPKRTLVQEYICNARDAMREVGKGNEFEITVPNRLNPVFKVRDFGPGISPERMRDVFIMYGASTKRGTNKQTGGFGIGAKSAWSYTDSFTIVSVVDGTKRTYVAHTGVNNNGRLDLIATDQTDEPNGTEIQVAVKQHDLDEFRSAIFRTIYFWKEKPTIKGELNVPTLTEGERIGQTVEVIDAEILPHYLRHYGVLAVIDGVPYPLQDGMVAKVKSLTDLRQLCRRTVILHFGNGLVEIAASREAIADSPATIDSLEKIGQKVLLEVKTHIADTFGKIKSTPEYLRTYAAVSQDFYCDEFAKYNGYEINRNVISSPTFGKVKMTLVHCMGKYQRGRVDKITKDELSEQRKKIDTDKLDHLFFVTKQENKLVQNKRIREYFKKHTHLILFEVLDTFVPRMDKQGKPVLDKENKQVYDPVSYPKEFQQVVADLDAKDFCSITYVDPPKVAKVKVKREDEELCLHGTRYGTRHLYTTLAKNTQKWIYVELEKGQWPNDCTREMATDLSEYTCEVEQAKVCGVSERVAKTVKNDPNFISLDAWLKAYKPEKEVIKAAKFKLGKHNSTAEALARLKDIEDPFLVEMQKEYADICRLKVASVPQVLANKIAELKEVKEFKEKDEKFGRLMKTEYPLVEELSRYSNNKKELVFYVNAKYKANKGK